jgi:hypothetical protein
MNRVQSQLSANVNCRESSNGETICKRMSRTFGNVSVVESSAFEKLINEADVSDYYMKATCNCFFFNSNISWERSQLVHQVKIFLWISIQVHLICGYHQATVHGVVVCFQYSFE